MDGIGTDNGILLTVISFRTNEELRAIAQAYNQEFKENLFFRIKTVTGGFTEVGRVTDAPALFIY